MRRLVKRPEHEAQAGGAVRDDSEIDDPAGILAGAPDPAPVMGRRRIAAPVQSAPIVDDDEERAAIQAEAVPSMRTPRGTPMQSNVIPVPSYKTGGLLPDAQRSAQSEVTDETVTVVFAEETYSPIQFNGYRVGPFTATVARRTNESIVEASQRALRQLEQVASTERERKLSIFMEHVEKGRISLANASKNRT